MSKIIHPNNCKKENKTIKIIKCCPRQPCILDNTRRPNKYEKGVVHIITDTSYNRCSKCTHCKFIIENFSGEILMPVNFNDFCLYRDLKDGDVVSYTREDVSKCCRSIYGKPIKLVRINRVWKRMIREAIGTVRVAPCPSANGQTYHQILDTRTNVQVTLIPNHTIGVPPSNDFQFINLLVGCTVQLTYVDDGEENNERCGIPIVILTISKV